MKLGVFDSGIGGKAIAKSLRQHFSDAIITVIDDHEHLPYGDKTRDEIRALTDTAIQPLIGNDIIVIACNSATAAAIDWLRAKYPAQKFVGIEPMIKPAAAATKTSIVAVCATPATLASERYRNLKRTYASNITVIEPDCSTWAKMIEDNNINEIIISKQIEATIAQGADVIVLGCTHYHWIDKLVSKIAAGRAQIFEPSKAIAIQVEKLCRL